MNDLGQIAEAGGKLAKASQHISRRGLQALALGLSFGLALGCVRFGGLEVEKAFDGGLRAILTIVLVAALSERR